MVGGRTAYNFCAQFYQYLRLLKIYQNGAAVGPPHCALKDPHRRPTFAPQMQRGTDASLAPVPLCTL